MRCLKKLKNGNVKFTLDAGRYEELLTRSKSDIEVELTHEEVLKLADRVGLVDASMYYDDPDEV